MGEDFNQLGRIYFPNIDFDRFTQEQKKLIEDDIQADFDAALIGIKKLKGNVKLGVYVAYRYYISLFHKIKKVPPHKLLSKRLRISNSKKFVLLVYCWIKYIFSLI